MTTTSVGAAWFITADTKVNLPGIIAELLAITVAPTPEELFNVIETLRLTMLLACTAAGHLIERVTVHVERDANVVVPATSTTCDTSVPAPVDVTVKVVVPHPDKETGEAPTMENRGRTRVTESVVSMILSS